MDNIIYLKKGDIYFSVGFKDPELTIPIIETYVYEGPDPEEGEDSHLLYGLDGDGNGYYLLFNTKKDIDVILDKKGLSEWLLEDHSPRKARKSYAYKTL